MKSRKEHRVPLSRAALVVLERADGLRGRGRGLVSPGIQGKMVGAAVFGRLLKDLGIDCSPHGFRSSFRSWCSDEGSTGSWRSRSLLTRSAARSSSATPAATCWSAAARSWSPGARSWSSRYYGGWRKVAEVGCLVRRVPASTEAAGARVLDVLRYASSVQLPERWGKPPRTPRRVPLRRVRIDATVHGLRHRRSSIHVDGCRADSGN